MLVISHLGGYPLSIIVTYSMISAYYALVLGNRPFPNLRIYVGNLVFTLKNIRLQNIKLIFPVILRIFDLESHSQISVKAEVFKKFRKLKSLYRKNKKLDLDKT